MKRLLVTVLIVISGLCCSCGTGSFKDIKVNHCDLVSVTPRGLSAFDALLQLNLDNPAPQVTLSQMSAVIRLDGTPCLHLSADDITIQPRSVLDYNVVFHGTIDENFNPFALIPYLQKRELEGLTIDLGFRGTLRSGLGKYFEYKDIPVKDIMGSL